MDLSSPLCRPYKVREIPPTDAGWFVAEGRHNVDALLSLGWTLDSVLITAGRNDDLAARVPAGVPLLRPDAAQTSEIIGYDFHHGAAAVARAPAKRRLHDALPDLFAPGGPPRTLVVCPCLGDASNLGAIIRNAAALGADAVICSERGVSPWSRKAVRASSGTLFRLPVIVSPDLHGDLAGLAERADTTLVALRLSPDAVPLSGWRPSGRHVVLMLGGEAHGLAPEWLAHPHDAVIIPMSPGVDSLNVAASSAVALYAVNSSRAGSGRP